RLLITRHRHGAAALHPALHRAALGTKLIAHGRRRHLLGAAGAGIVVRRICATANRFIVIARAIRRDRLVIGLGLVSGHGLVIATLHVTGRALRGTRSTARRRRRVVTD